MYCSQLPEGASCLLPVKETMTEDMTVRKQQHESSSEESMENPCWTYEGLSYEQRQDSTQGN
jgi:hypothetical protein